MVTRFFLLLFVLCSSIQLAASNFHEHLCSLPTSDNLIQSAESIFMLPEKSQKLAAIFKTHSDLHHFISRKWGKSKADAFVAENSLEKTLTQLCCAMHKDPKVALNTLLAFDLGKDSSDEERQKLYVDLEEVRKAIIFSLSPEEVEKVFARYFEEEPLANRKVISVTVTRRFFEPAQQQKHRRLKQLAEKYGSQLVYRVSLQRQTLVNEGIALNKESFALIERGEIAGIDIVGSLDEKRHIYKAPKEQIKKHLLELFDFISDRSLVLVLHLFEGMNQGPFYDILEQTLRGYNRSLFLEIGHIAHLNDHWMAVFSSNPQLKVLFHVNVRSNELLQGCAIPEIKETVEKLLAKGFTVVPGSDGRGILPGATYLEQTHLLGHALHEHSFLSQQDAKRRSQSTIGIASKLTILGLSALNLNWLPIHVESFSETNMYKLNDKTKVATLARRETQ